MRLINRLLFAAAFLSALTCVYGQEVHYNYDRGAKFAAYKTYQWVDLDGKVPDQLIDQSIKRAIDEQLAQKGLTRVEKDADLYLGYQAVITAEKSINLNGWSDGWGGGWGGFGGGRSSTVTGQTGTIPVGVLLVDVYDPVRKQLIWRGDVGGVIDLNKDPDKNYRKLQKGMTKLFKNYPPQPK